MCYLNFAVRSASILSIFHIQTTTWPSIYWKNLNFFHHQKSYYKFNSMEPLLLQLYCYDHIYGYSDSTLVYVLICVISNGKREMIKRKKWKMYDRRTKVNLLGWVSTSFCDPQCARTHIAHVTHPHTHQSKYSCCWV